MAVKRPARFHSAERASGVPIWLKVTGGTLAALVAAHFYLIHQINKVADSIVQAAGMFSAPSHRGGYYTWDGNLGIKKLRIDSMGDSASSMYMAELELDTPGWWWVLQLVNPLDGSSSRFARAFDSFGGDRGGSLLPAADSLYLRMRGLELNINDLMPPGLPKFGFTTGVPFETEGCTEIRYFVPLQLQNDLQLPYKQTDLSFGFAGTGPDQVVVSMEIDAPGLVSSRFEVDWTTDQPRRFLESDGNGERVGAMRWIISDQGFNAARNRWCAEQANVDADEFQRRHITTVRRILEIYGVRLAPEVEALYSAFARNGGTLVMEAKWPTEVNAELYAQYPAEQKWQVLDARIWHDNGAKLPLALSFVSSRPLPRAFSGSVYDLIARNADAAAAGTASPFEGLGDRMRELTAAPGSVEAAAAAPAPAAPPAPLPKRPSRPQPTPIGLDTPSLIAAIGETVAIETDDGRKRIGQLTAVNKTTLTIQQRVSGGKADLDFTRERIRKVTANP
jgi:hypothetical protein